MIEERSKLKNIQVFEVAFPLTYTFRHDQKLKEAWGIFSITGQSIIPVINQDNQIVGTLSIFSVPKPEKEHMKTKAVEIDQELESIGNFLTDKLFKKQKKIK